MDKTKIIQELLTCEICQNIGFRKATTLLLLPDCQHYFCETRVKNMRERASAQNQATFECPFCRVPVNVEDDQLTPRFRYAENLAVIMLTDGKKKMNQRPASASAGSPKPVLLKQVDMAQAPIITFMPFGKGITLYTSAGAVSLEFDNPGIYIMELGIDELRHFGALDWRYDGLAFNDNKLFAVNYTKWRLEIYDTRGGISRWPELETSFSLKSCKPSDISQEIHVVTYKDYEGIHIIFNCQHVVIRLAENVTHLVRSVVDSDFANNVTRLMVFASSTEKWYMKGEKLFRTLASMKRKLKQTTLTNWTDVCFYDREMILYAVQDSPNIFIAELEKLSKEDKIAPVRINSPQRQTKLNTLFVNTARTVPVKLASLSDGYIAAVVHIRTQKSLHLDAKQRAIIEKTTLDDKKEEPDGTSILTNIMILSSGPPLTLLAMWTAILVFCFVQVLILYRIYLIQGRLQQDFGISMSFNVIDILVVTFTEFDIAHIAA